MFADGLTISFEGFLSIVVTAVGIWFVVQQLKQTKISTQAETLLTLKSTDMREYRTLLVGLTNSEKWKKFGEEEVYKFLSKKENVTYSSALSQFSDIYETVAILVKTKALDFSLAYEVWGFLLPDMWHRTEKWHLAARKELNMPFQDQWEWMAKEFESETARRNS